MSKHQTLTLKNAGNAGPDHSYLTVSSAFSHYNSKGELTLAGDIPRSPELRIRTAKHDSPATVILNPEQVQALIAYLETFPKPSTAVAHKMIRLTDD